MKNLIIASFLLFANGLCAQQYTIKGTIPKTPNGTKVFLFKQIGNEFVSDSATINKNQFLLTGDLNSPGTVYVQIKRKDGKRRKGDLLETFIGAENVILSTKDSLSNAKITGSKLSEAFQKMKAAIKPANDKIEALSKKYETAYNAKKVDEMAKLEEEIDAVTNVELWKGYQSFIESNPKSTIALTAFENMVGYDIDYNKANPIWDKIDATLKVSEKGKALQEKLNIAYTTRVGAEAIGFEQNGVDGKAIPLSSFKGKYVLIDFWASWCGPCRAENPNVVATFEKYKDKNFTVLGVSLDTNKDKWVKAIADDKLNWTQVSDLKGWGNSVAAQYGVKGIPQNFLIDPKGMIVGRNLRGAALEAKLAEFIR